MQMLKNDEATAMMPLLARPREPRGPQMWGLAGHKDKNELSRVVGGVFACCDKVRKLCL